MSDLSKTSGVGLRSKVRFFARLVAVLMAFVVGRLAAQGIIENPTVDARVEAFALDGGTKTELIAGMEKSEVISQLKVVRSRYDAIYSYGDSKAMYSDEALLRMGDEETILRLIDQYHKGEGHGESVLMAANETALKYLIEDVRSGSEEWRRRAYDSWALPIRFKSTERVLLIVKRNQAFPEKTRQWADRMHTLVGVNGEGHRAANTVVKWWEINEAAILEGRYADATWLPAAAENHDSENQRMLRRPGDDKRDSLSNSGSVDDSQDLKTAQDSNHKMKDRINVALYAAGALLIAYIIWLLMKNRIIRIKRK